MNEREPTGRCHVHGPFFGEMVPRHVLRMKREPGGNREVALVQDSDDEVGDDVDLAEDV